MTKFLRFTCLFIGLALMTGFSSCSSDDDDGPSSNSIVGTWEYIEAESGYYYSSVYTFSNDGSWVELWEETAYNHGSAKGSSGGKYTAKDGRLTLKYEWDDDKMDPGDKYTYFYSMPDKNTLILRDPDDDEETHAYKRK